MNLFSSIGAIFVFLLSLPMLYTMWEDGADALRARHVADHLIMVNRAAASYVRSNGATLLDTTTATSGPELGIADLIAADLLPDGFNDRNPVQQTYRIFIRRPANNQLQAIALTTGGPDRSRDRRFANSLMPQAAANIGGAGGFIPTGDVPGTSPGTLRGAFGGWVLDLASMNIPSPGPGHVGTVNSFDSSDMAQDFLYRIEVPGHEELNQMWANLDMTGKAIERIGEADFVPATLASMQKDGVAFCADGNQNGRLFLHETNGLYVCRNGRAEAVADTGNSAHVREMTIAAHGDVVAKPVCPEGTGTSPEIYLSPVTMAEAGQNATPLVAVQSWATSLSDSSWQVNLRLMTTNSKNTAAQWVYPTADYGRVMVTTLCRRTNP